MFCQLLAISLALVTCDAQEHLTCLRTDNVINPSPQPSPTGIQGRPGRRGPRGEKGESIVGMKGEPGIPDNSLIESLRDNITRALQRGYMELKDGWVAPFNGYQYKITPNYQSWVASRNVCQSWGGDLIVHGFRDHAVRVTIARAVGRSGFFHYIGLSDEATEGDWRWVNGHQAKLEDVTLWRVGEPNGGRRQNCAVVHFHDSSGISGFLVFDQGCSFGRYAVCEKLI